IYPVYMEGGIKLLLDRTKPWDAEGNCPPLYQFGKDPDPGSVRIREFGTVHLLQCPSRPTPAEPGLPAVTHYMGVAGVGADAAELPLADRRAGFFGYDRKVNMTDIKDGLSCTVAAIEAADGGHWTAG